MAGRWFLGPRPEAGDLQSNAYANGRRSTVDCTSTGQGLARLEGHQLVSDTAGQPQWPAIFGLQSLGDLNLLIEISVCNPIAKSIAGARLGRIKFHPDSRT